MAPAASGSRKLTGLSGTGSAAKATAAATAAAAATPISKPDSQSSNPVSVDSQDPISSPPSSGQLRDAIAAISSVLLALDKTTLDLLQQPASASDPQQGDSGVAPSATVNFQPPPLVPLPHLPGAASPSVSRRSLEAQRPDLLNILPNLLAPLSPSCSSHTAALQSADQQTMMAAAAGAAALGVPVHPAVALQQEMMKRYRVAVEVALGLSGQTVASLANPHFGAPQGSAATAVRLASQLRQASLRQGSSSSSELKDVEHSKNTVSVARKEENERILLMRKRRKLARQQEESALRSARKAQIASLSSSQSSTTSASSQPPLPALSAAAATGGLAAGAVALLPPPPPTRLSFSSEPRFEDPVTEENVARWLGRVQAKLNLIRDIQHPTDTDEMSSTVIQLTSWADPLPGDPAPMVRFSVTVEVTDVLRALITFRCPRSPTDHTGESVGSVVRINVRAPSESSSDESDRYSTGTSVAFAPSSFTLYRGIGSHLFTHASQALQELRSAQKKPEAGGDAKELVQPDEPHPLALLSKAIHHIHALRSIYRPAPPLLPLLAIGLGVPPMQAEAAAAPPPGVPLTEHELVRGFLDVRSTIDGGGPFKWAWCGIRKSDEGVFTAENGAVESGKEGWKAFHPTCALSIP